MYLAYLNTPLAWTLAEKGLQDRLTTVLDRPTDDGQDGVENLATEIEYDVTLDRRIKRYSKCHKEIKRREHGRKDPTIKLFSREEHLS